ncbi:hypothetical protein RKLH11_4240 [Rhodobacteraceae bacterium KLH11]|nr:hypothetical protein RKLH11_4240 [Rhodobacteraceae bacterium KLH11]
MLKVLLIIQLGFLGGLGLLVTATTAPAQEVRQADPENTDLRDIIALRQELLADVRALKRIAAYQAGLLRLAEEDPQDALDARQPRQNCMEEIAAPEFCAALSGSYKGAE